MATDKSPTTSFLGVVEEVYTDRIVDSFPMSKRLGPPEPPSSIVGMEEYGPRTVDQVDANNELRGQYPMGKRPTPYKITGPSQGAI